MADPSTWRRITLKLSYTVLCEARYKNIVGYQNLNLSHICLGTLFYIRSNKGGTFEEEVLRFSVYSSSKQLMQLTTGKVFNLTT